MSHLSAAMRAALGEVVDRRVSHPIALSDIRRWAIAVYYPDDPPRRFRDEASEIVAPEEFNPFAWTVAEARQPVIVPAKRDPDRLEKAIGIAGPGLRNQLNGGTSVVYGVPMRPGDVITSETRLKEYREREGRLGPMLITVTEDRWTNQRGERVSTCVNTSIRY